MLQKGCNLFYKCSAWSWRQTFRLIHDIHRGSAKAHSKTPFTHPILQNVCTFFYLILQMVHMIMSSSHMSWHKPCKHTKTLTDTSYTPFSAESVYLTVQILLLSFERRVDICVTHHNTNCATALVHSWFILQRFLFSFKRRVVVRRVVICVTHRDTNHATALAHSLTPIPPWLRDPQMTQGPIHDLVTHPRLHRAWGVLVRSVSNPLQLPLPL